MSEAIEHLQKGLSALPLPDGWSHQYITSQDAEFFAEVGGQRLEVERRGVFVSLAFGPTLWEDMPLRTIDDADRLLAACDAILDGRYSETRRRNWFWQSIRFRLELSSRGFEESWTDVNYGWSGRGPGRGALAKKST
ncbi:hypothetical protein [Brevundimonas sp.]|uniref:hypothetical protein n=1 Tax=Brevundimonas sp. TaxID=1871086 RepID=UPI0035B21431